MRRAVCIHSFLPETALVVQQNLPPTVRCAPPTPRVPLTPVRTFPNPKPEDRRPKEIRSPKSESSGVVTHGIGPVSDFGFRHSFGLRVSVFGFLGCGAWSPINQADFRAALSGRYFFFFRKTALMADLDASPRWRTFNWPRMECQPI